MTIDIDQYTIETTWSTRLADDIVLDSIQRKIPTDMETNIMNTITELNTNKWIENINI